MTADLDSTLDSVLTAAPKEAWQVIFEKLWEIFSAHLTSQHAEQEVTERERKVSGIELLLSSSGWELWREFESAVPRTAKSVIDFWNSALAGKAVLILDGLSLRESPWLLQEAKRRGYHIQQVGARGSEIPSDTTPFAKALGFGQRSSIENNGAGLAHLLPGARTESLNAAWDYCLDWIASAPLAACCCADQEMPASPWKNAVQIQALSVDLRELGLELELSGSRAVAPARTRNRMDHGAQNRARRASFWRQTAPLKRGMRPVQGSLQVCQKRKETAKHGSLPCPTAALHGPFSRSSF
jgi:hypothetical protein